MPRPRRDHRPPGTHDPIRPGGSASIMSGRDAALASRLSRLGESSRAGLVTSGLCITSSEGRACSDPGPARRCWPSDHHNVGIACGPSRLVVVDLDTHSPLPEDWRLPGVHDGRDLLALLAQWAGQPWPVTHAVVRPRPEVCTCTTPRRTARGSVTARARSARSSTSGAAAVTCWPRARCSTSAPTQDNAECRELVTGGRGYEVADGSDPGPLPAWLGASAAGAGPVARPGGSGQARVPLPAPGCRALSPPVPRRPGRRPQRPAVLGGPPGGGDDRRGEVDRGTAEEFLVAAALEAGLRGGEREARRTFASAIRGGGL